MDTDGSPANVEAATMFKENIKEYERRVKVGSTQTMGTLLTNRQRSSNLGWIPTKSLTKMRRSLRHPPTRETRAQLPSRLDSAIMQVSRPHSSLRNPTSRIHCHHYASSLVSYTLRALS